MANRDRHRVLSMGGVAALSVSAAFENPSITRGFVFVLGGIDSDWILEGTPDPATNEWAQIFPKVLSPTAAMLFVRPDPFPLFVRMNNVGVTNSLEWWIDGVREIA